MIYILDLNDEILEIFDIDDDYIFSGNVKRNVENLEETFTFSILTEYSLNLQKRNRILVRDNNERLREFIIMQVEQDLDGITEVSCVASYLEDFATAKPIEPKKLERNSTIEALEYFSADTGWEVAPENEFGGNKTVSWEAWTDRFSNLKMLQTAFDMRLDFYVEVDSNKVTNRYVFLKKVDYLDISTLDDDNPNFKGAEVIYGENMTGLKRTIDFTEVRTALLALGPENQETGDRLILDYKDEEAQAQFGLPERYIYDLYEPQSNDENMTKKRLETLSKTQLEKINKTALSYEVSSLEINADIGDMIRIKNEDFTPELYVDAEVIEINYDIISGISDLKFGVIKEYERQDVYARFSAMLDKIREQLSNVTDNADTIIDDILERKLDEFERYIHKSEKPPLNPKEGDLWLKLGATSEKQQIQYQIDKLKEGLKNFENLSQQDRQKLIERIEDKQKELEDLENGKELKEQQNRDEIERLNRLIYDFVQEIKEHRDRHVEELNNDVDRKNSEIEKLNNAIEDKLTVDIENKRKEYNAEIEKLESKRDELVTERNRLQEEIERKQAQYDKFEKEYQANVEERNAETVKKINLIKEQTNAYVELINKHRNEHVERLRGEIASKFSEKERLEQQYEEIKSTIKKRIADKTERKNHVSKEIESNNEKYLEWIEKTKKYPDYNPYLQTEVDRLFKEYIDDFDNIFKQLEQMVENEKNEHVKNYFIYMHEYYKLESYYYYYYDYYVELVSKYDVYDLSVLNEYRKTLPDPRFKDENEIYKFVENNVEPYLTEIEENYDIIESFEIGQNELISKYLSFQKLSKLISENYIPREELIAQIEQEMREKSSELHVEFEKLEAEIKELEERLSKGQITEEIIEQIEQLNQSITGLNERIEELLSWQLNTHEDTPNAVKLNDREGYTNQFSDMNDLFEEQKTLENKLDDGMTDEERAKLRDIQDSIDQAKRNLTEFDFDTKDESLLSDINAIKRKLENVSNDIRESTRYEEHNRIAELQLEVSGVQNEISELNSWKLSTFDDYEKALELNERERYTQTSRQDIQNYFETIRDLESAIGRANEVEIERAKRELQALQEELNSFDQNNNYTAKIDAINKQIAKLYVDLENASDDIVNLTPQMYVFKDGKWVKASIDNVEELGGMTKEQTLYETLELRYARNELSYVSAFNRYDNLTNDKYYKHVKEELKDSYSKSMSDLSSRFVEFKTAFESIDKERPLMTLIAEAIQKAIKFEEELKNYEEVYLEVRESYDEYIRILQSQYTEEKFNEALQEVADSIGGEIDGNGNIDITNALNERLDSFMNKVANSIGGAWNGSELIADIPNQKALEDLNDSIKEYVNGELNALDGKLGKQIETVVEQATNSFSAEVNTIDKRVSGLDSQISNISQEVDTTSSSLKVLENKINLKVDDKRVKQILDDELKPIKSQVQTNASQFEVLSNRINSKVESSTYEVDKDNIVSDLRTARSEISQTDKKIDSNVSSLTRKIDDTNASIRQAHSKITQLENMIDLEVDEEQVKRILNAELQTLRTEVERQSSRLSILNNSINSKVSSSTYQADKNNIVNDLRTARSEINQLSDKVTSAITVDEYKNGTSNLLLDSGSQPATTDYTIKEYDMTEKLEKNKTYTFQLKGSVTNSSYNYKQIALARVYNGSLYYIDYNIYRNSDGIYEVTFTTDSSYTWNTDKLRVINYPSGYGNRATIEWAKLEKGAIATAYYPAPNDNEKILTQMQSEIEQTKLGLNTKVSYTEMNGTQKTLEKLLTEFSQTSSGFNFRIDSNGMIQDLTFDRYRFKLNSNLIEFNDGDVIIKDGRTTIKDAFIEKLKSNIITSEQVRIAYNNISNSLQITPGGLETTIEGSLASRLNSFGHHFYFKGDYIGAIGTGNLSNYPNVRGLSMTLDSYGEYLAFGYRSGNVDADDPAQVALLWSKGSGGYSRGFHFNEDIKIKHNKVIETLWLRPSNYNTVGERISFSSGQIGGVQGVSLRYNSSRGSGVHLSHDQVTVHADDSSKPGVGDLAVSFDSRSYYVRSYITYHRTYSYGSNVYITSNGVFGRTTSARKYKLSIENQFKDDNKQLEHSKKILELDPKTWFDKSEAEIYAEELKTGKKQTDDKFSLKRHFGMIADEFEEIGMKELVSYDDKGEVEGLAYDRIPVHHNVLIKDLYKENDELKSEIKELNNKIDKIMEMIA